MKPKLSVQVSNLDMQEQGSSRSLKSSPILTEDASNRQRMFPSSIASMPSALSPAVQPLPREVEALVLNLRSLGCRPTVTRTDEMGSDLLKTAFNTIRDESLASTTKSRMLKSLHSALDESPFLCEQMFVHNQGCDAFRVALDTIEVSTEDYMVHGLVNILATAVSHAGIGVEHTQ